MWNHRTCQLVLACWMLVSTLRGQEGPAQDLPNLAVESFKLANGLRVVLHQDHSVPRVVVCVAYHVGSKNERAGRTGFAHFFEHMMFRGTRHVPNYDMPLQEAGASANAFTSEDLTVYFEAVPREYLERALYLEAERLAFLPTGLDLQKFDTEREVVKNERLQSYENVPYGLAQETLLATVFTDGHPYSWSVIGSMADLNRSTLDDLVAFFHEFYHPGNATLCLAGDFDPQPTRALIERYFGILAPGPGVTPVVAPRVASQGAARTQVDRVQLPRTYWAWPTVEEEHADSPALQLLATILGDGEASRLYRSLIRDSQVASLVTASSEAKEIAGFFQVSATLAEGQDPKQMEQKVVQEIERLRDEPPSQDELARAQSQFERSQYSLLTMPVMRAVALARGSVQYGDAHHYRRDFARHQQVTAEQIQRVARTYLGTSPVLLRVMPAKEGQEESSATLAGPKHVERPARRPTKREPKPGMDWQRLPLPSEAQRFQPPDIVRMELVNGIPVWFVPWRTLPVVELRLILPFGAVDDVEETAGLAELVARSMDKGTRDMTAEQFVSALETLGASESIVVGPDRTQLAISVLRRNLRPVLDMIGRMLAEPRFDEADVAREQQLLLNDLLQGPDNPTWVASRVFRGLLFDTHPYGNPTQGHAATVEKLTAESVRSFHQRHVSARGAKLILSGDLADDELKTILDETLGSWAAAEWAADQTDERRVTSRLGLARASADGESLFGRSIFFVPAPGAVQSVVSVGRSWRGRDDARYFETLLGNRVLGGDFLSRLNQNLREKNGFTYGAGSRFDYLGSQGIWTAQSLVRADATGPALREILAEFAATTEPRPLADDEIELNRQAELRSFPETWESPARIVGALEELARFNLEESYFQRYEQALRDAPSAGIRQITGELTQPDAMTILVVGDPSTVEPQLRAIQERSLVRLTQDGKRDSP